MLAVRQDDEARLGPGCSSGHRLCGSWPVRSSPAPHRRIRPPHRRICRSSLAMACWRNVVAAAAALPTVQGPLERVAPPLSSRWRDDVPAPPLATGAPVLGGVVPRVEFPSPGQVFSESLAKAIWFCITSDNDDACERRFPPWRRRLATSAHTHASTVQRKLYARCAGGVTPSHGACGRSFCAYVCFIDTSSSWTTRAVAA